MGTVYRARDRHSGDLVALKLLHPDRSSGDDAGRFLREARLLSELQHPGIVAHVAHGQIPEGARFLAMEWLEGHDLRERLADGALPVADCVRILEQVADALALAHERGIVHRDLKPSNLFLVGGDPGRVKILDFGIARRIGSADGMTRTGVVVGTPEYMAPEQARGHRKLTPASDLFSLGCILYACLAGRPPFCADSVPAALIQILFEDPVPIAERRLGISPALSELVHRLLNKQSELRPPDAAALRAELQRLGELPESVAIAPVLSPSPKTVSFAEEEQSLFSVVLAALPDVDPQFAATAPGRGGVLDTADRQSLLQLLAGLGGSPDFLANGTLVVAVHPMESAHDQATVAARAALLIKERWPGAMVSMATGRGTINARVTVGEVVEQAALALKHGDRSTPGSEPRITGVWMDSLSAKLLAGRFAQTPRPSGAILHYEERDSDASRSLLGKPTPCLGRDAEISSLAAQLSSCIDESEPRVVLVTAPPGVGKSRLRHEFLRRVEQRSESVTVLLGRGEMITAGASYGVLRSAVHKLCGVSGGEPLDIQRARLRSRIGRHVAVGDSERVCQFVGELANIPPAEEGLPMLQAARQDPKIMNDCVRRAFLDFLAAECAAAPLLLVLDDLQWADGPTISILDDALRELADARLFVLSFARPEVYEAFPKLRDFHNAQELPLKGLSKKACGRLIAQVLGTEMAPAISTAMIEQCGGNALYLEELIRSYAEGNASAQPDTIVAMLQARIGRLDSNARRAVRAAAVFGQTFWLRGVEAVLGQTADAKSLEAWLATLVAAELIRPHIQSRLASQVEYGFRHALVRDAAYGLLTDSDLRTGHLLAGDFLAAAGESNAAVIADHLERGGDLGRAATFHAQAAETSVEQFDLAGALRHVSRGLQCDPDLSVRGKLRGIECFAAFFLHQHERVAGACSEALSLSRPGSLDWCRSAPGAYFVALLSQNIPQALARLNLLLATEPDANAQHSYLFGVVAILAMQSLSAPMTLLESMQARVADCCQRWSDKHPAAQRHILVVRVQLATYRNPTPWSLVSDAEAAIQLGREVGDNLVELALGTHLLAWGWLDLGAREKMEAHLRSMEGLVARSQTSAVDLPYREVLARVLAESPHEHDWLEAERLVTPILELPEIPVLYTCGAQELLARVALQRGQLESAEARARKSLESLAAGPLWFLPTASVLIRALLALGRPAEAMSVAEQLLAYFPVLGGGGVFEVEFRVAASEAFRAAKDPPRAVSELRETLRQIQLRADNITDPAWKTSYLTRNPYCVRAQQLAKEWAIDPSLL